MIKSYFIYNTTGVNSSKELSNTINKIISITSNVQPNIINGISSTGDYGVTKEAAEAIIKTIPSILRTSAFDSYLQHAWTTDYNGSRYAVLEFIDPAGKELTSYIIIEIDALNTTNIYTYYNYRRPTTSPARDMTAEAAIIIRKLIEEIKTSPEDFNNVSSKESEQTPSLMDVQIKISPSSIIGILAKLLLGQDFKNGITITLKIPRSLWESKARWQDIDISHWFTDILYDIDLT
jgi:hypothetical protein